MRSCYYHKISSTELAVLDNCDYYNDGHIITRINVPHKQRGRGFGSLLLLQCLSDADRERVTMWLEISPSDGLDYPTLEAWYLRHGFKNVGGIYRRRPLAPLS